MQGNAAVWPNLIVTSETNMTQSHIVTEGVLDLNSFVCKGNKSLTLLLDLVKMFASFLDVIFLLTCFTVKRWLNELFSECTDSAPQNYPSFMSSISFKKLCRHQCCGKSSRKLLPNIFWQVRWCCRTFFFTFNGKSLNL